MSVVDARDVHWIVAILRCSAVLIENRDRLSGGLGIGLGELADIKQIVNLNVEGSYGYFTRVLNEWINKKSAGATFENLASMLRAEGFSKAADDLEKECKQQRQLDSLKSQASQAEVSVNNAEFWNVPPKNINFIGRTGLLGEIDKYFSPETSHALIGVICGLGGIGKSSVALEYAWTRRSNYKIIYWFHAEQRSPLLTEYRNLAKKFGLTQGKEPLESIAMELKDWLERTENLQKSICQRVITSQSSGLLTILL
jgi:RNA binding exosome subunit